MVGITQEKQIEMIFQLMFEIIKRICQLQVCLQTVPNYWCQIQQILLTRTCFLKDVLVSKQKILHLLDFDQIVYIYHENIEGKFP